MTRATEQDLKEFDKCVVITVRNLSKAIDEITKAEEIINTEHCTQIQMRDENNERAIISQFNGS